MATSMIFLGIGKNPIRLRYAILFFVAMSIVFSLLYWVFLPFLEGSPSIGFSANRLSDHRSLNFFECLFFSATTQTLVGYGDIIPISALGKVCTVSQAAFGYFYLAYLVSFFMSKAIMRPKRTQTYLPHTEETGKVLRIR